MDPLHVIAAAAGETFGIGVIVSAFLFGFRHGIDWDHIAAITDIAGSQDDRRSAMFFGTLYALGHALVVFLDRDGGDPARRAAPGVRSTT